MAMTMARSGHPTSLRTSTLVIGKRGVLKFLRTPQLVALGTIQGALFLVIFRYVFGGAIGIGGMDYVDFLVPGFITTAVLFLTMDAATGIAEDLEQGFVDRLRSLPIPRSAILGGRALADTAVLTWGLGITAAIGFAVGFRIHGSPVLFLVMRALYADLTRVTLNWARPRLHRARDRSTASPTATPPWLASTGSRSVSAML